MQGHLLHVEGHVELKNRDFELSIGKFSPIFPDFEHKEGIPEYITGNIESFFTLAIILFCTQISSSGTQISSSGNENKNSGNENNNSGTQTKNSGTIPAFFDAPFSCCNELTSCL